MLPIPDTQSTYFNPRSLHGERLRRNQYLQAPPYFNPRSLHGERRYRSNLRASTIYFNPRSLHGERPYNMVFPNLHCQFQSTLPARGATLLVCEVFLPLYISIHAPCTGSDPPPCPPTTATAHFNPRSLHGERPQKVTLCAMGKPFQSTLPARGATPCDRNSVTVSVFQSTLPARGATRRSMPQASRRRRFQSTLPARGATNIRLCYTADGSISIHAPCTGSDPFQQKSSVSFLSLFQSTLPARGATFFVQIAYNSIGNFNPRSLHGERHQPSKDTIAAMLISIHAPCTGSDCARWHSAKKSSYFNPRSLHGERRLHAKALFCPTAFQSTLPARGATAFDYSHDPRTRISIHAPCTGSDAHGL